MVDKTLINALRDDDSDALKSVYLNNKAHFIGFARKYPIDGDSIIDIYQNTIIAFRENAINGKLDTLKVNLDTYLFSIGKYMIFKKLKEQKRMHLVNHNYELDNLSFETDNPYEIVEDLTEEQKLLRDAYSKLGQKCKDVLTLFYYRGFTIDEITEELNYASKDVAKSQKSRCLKSLKALILKPKNG